MSNQDWLPQKKNGQQVLLIIILLLAMLNGACQRRSSTQAVPQTNVIVQDNRATNFANSHEVLPKISATPTLMPLIAITAVPSPTPKPLSVYVQPALPVFEQQLNELGMRSAEQADAADALVVHDAQTERPLAELTYALVARLYTVTDAWSADQLAVAWQQGQLAIAADDEAIVTAILGPPQVQPPVVASVSAYVAERPDAFGIVPFDQLTPTLKVIEVDGMSPLRTTFSAEQWPLTLRLALVNASAEGERFDAIWQNRLLVNRQSERMTRVALTGVTALVRATASQMEINGILWPGEEVREVLRSADIAHLSNEVAFYDACPYPNPIGGTSFCSSPRYFELLTDLGIDVVELTGNHVNDYGAVALATTIEQYRTAGMQTFGGGLNTADALNNLTIDHNGNQIAFVGCNPVGPAYAWVGVATAGSRPCDAQVSADVADLAAQGYVVIMTLQYHEFYSYAPTAQQRVDFQAWVDRGATIVSGSQAHHAQGYELYNGGLIHYGPGNLFFDQMDQLGTRQTVIDEYVIYDGRLIGLEMTTGLIENYARPRLMTSAERAQFLQTLFSVSR